MSLKSRHEHKGIDSPIDYSSALERMEGDKSLLRELVNLYIKQFWQKYNRLQKAIKEKNFNLIQEFGHSFKGSSANLSLIYLQEASLLLEMSGREKNTQKAKKAFSLLEQEIKRLENFLLKMEMQNQKEPGRKKKNENFLSKSSRTDSGRLPEVQILVADDSTDNQLLMRTYFSQAGIGLDIANNGQEAVELFRKKNYSLIFLDIHMPEKNGLEALKEMRSIGKEKPFAPTPIIALTGSSFSEEKEKCLALGFNEYVEKPFEKGKIMKIVHKYLETGDDVRLSNVIHIDKSIKDLVPDYLKNRKNDIEKMTTALRVFDFSKIESIAHQIKGSGESYGFKRISQIGQKIEKAAQENDHQKIRQLLEKFKNYLENIHYE